MNAVSENSVALVLRLIQLWRVSKLALGKGLSDWLKTRPEGKPIVGSDPSPAAPITPGVGALLRGKNGEAEASPTPQSQVASRQIWPSIRWILWVADFVLIAFCALLTLSPRHPLGFLEVTLCFMAACLGATLAVIALLGPDFKWPKREDQ